MVVKWFFVSLLCGIVAINIVVGTSTVCDTAEKLERKTGPFDDTTLVAGTWYKVPYYELVDDAAAEGDCGTTYPVWASGDSPDNEGDEADVKMCVVSSTSSCSRNFTIKIHNCGKYDVYHLQPTSSSDEAYCFKHDDDDDDDCEEEKHHGKRFHRCHRKHRYFVVVIGIVVIAMVMIAIAAIFLYRRRRAAILKRQAAYKEKDPQAHNGPVVVTTDGQLPPKKF